MCRKEVMMFNCGHTRKRKMVLCNDLGMECPEPERVLIPQGSYDSIARAKVAETWTCPFKCQEGKASHEPLINACKEDTEAVKRNIDNKDKLLMDVMTPANEITGFWFKVKDKSVASTPSHELNKFDFGDHPDEQESTADK